MTPVNALLSVLDLQPAGTNRFTGTSLTFGPRVFGGQVIAQALVAAARTVPAERPAHSLHAYFLEPGDPAVPIDFTVDRLRDGGAFSTRQVTARQGGRAMLTLTASFQREETGLAHQVAMPDVPRPETLPTPEAFRALAEAEAVEPVRRYLARPRPIVLLPADPAGWLRRKGGETRQAIWMRTAAGLPDDPALHLAVIAYLSDMTLLDAATAAHGRSVFDRDLTSASLDHAIWFHRPARADAWLLYAQETPSAGGARGFTRAHLFGIDGTLVASVAQEGLIRVRPGA